MITINTSTRQFNIPGADLVFGVTGDAGSAVKEFSCPRYVGNNLDLTGCFIRMNYRNANGEVDSYLVPDVTVDGDNVVFGWELTPKVTMYKGQVSFVMCVTGPDTKVAWHTTLGKGQVLEGLEPDSDMVENGTADVVAALIAMVEAQTVAVENKGAEWVRNVQSEGTDQISAVQTAGKNAESDAVAEIEAKGVNTRNSIPADYTALSEAVDTLNRTRGAAIVCSVEGSAITVNDASDMVMQGLRIFGRSTQDGTPTPDAPVEIKSVENPTISVNEQTLRILRTLPGIPVASGGNYTDSDGQQWICDEVDLERGVYVQRVASETLNRQMNFIKNSEDATNYLYWARSAAIFKHGVGLSTHAEVTNTPPTQLIGMMYHGSANALFFNPGETIMLQHGNTVDGLAAYLDAEYENGTPVVFVGALATPIETPLSETEIAAYRNLHSNYPNTTVLNDSGAHMVVKYAADTKLYIDNKITALIGG